MIAWRMSVAAAALLVAGCGGAEENTSAPTQSKTSTSAEAAAAPDVEDAPDDGEMTAVYEDATTPKRRTGAS